VQLGRRKCFLHMPPQCRWWCRISVGVKATGGCCGYRWCKCAMAIFGGNIFQQKFGIKLSYFSIILQTNETITCGNGHGMTMKQCRQAAGQQSGSRACRLQYQPRGIISATSASAGWHASARSADVPAASLSLSTYQLEADACNISSTGPDSQSHFGLGLAAANACIK